MGAAEARAIVDVVLRGAATPPDVAALAPPQLDDVDVEDGLFVALQRAVATEAMGLSARRRNRDLRGIRSHARRQRNTRARWARTNFRVNPRTLRRES